MILLQYPPTPQATLMPPSQVPVVPPVPTDYSSLMQPPQPRIAPTMICKQVQVSTIRSVSIKISLQTVLPAVAVLAGFHS